LRRNLFQALLFPSELFINEILIIYSLSKPQIQEVSRLQWRDRFLLLFYFSQHAYSKCSQILFFSFFVNEEKGFKEKKGSLGSSKQMIIFVAFVDLFY